MRLTKKLKTVVEEYCQAHVRYTLWDCCDSMHELEVLNDNKVSIENYIKENFAAYYIEQVKEAAKETGETIDELRESAAGQLLIKL